MGVGNRIFVALGFAALALGVPAAAKADPVKLRIAWIVPAADAPLSLFGRPGLAQHAGQSYTTEFVHFSGTPPMITALASDEVDLAVLAFSSIALAVENAKLEDLRILADMVQDGVGNYFSNQFVVLTDGPVKKVEDLKGRVISSNAAGGAIDIVMRVMLRRHGLEDKRDYTFIEGAFPNLKAMLIEHKTDLITMVPPFAKDPALRAVAQPLFTQQEVMGKTEVISLSTRAGTIAKNRAAIVDFLEDELRARRWYLDPANRDEALKIVSDFTKTPTTLWSSWLFTAEDIYRAPDGKPDLEAMQRNIAVAHEAGYLPAELDPKKYADLSLVEEAAKRLK